mgnify:FL=1
MNTDTLEEIQIREAGAGKQWRTFKADHNTLVQQRWYKGRKQVRVLHYGTLGNPHAPSRWRVACYLGKNEVAFDTAKIGRAHV